MASRLRRCHNCPALCASIFCCLACAEERWAIQQEAFHVLQTELAAAMRDSRAPVQQRFALAAAAAAVYSDPG